MKLLSTYNGKKWSLKSELKNQFENMLHFYASFYVLKWDQKLPRWVPFYKD